MIDESNLPPLETWRSPEAVRAQAAYRQLVIKALSTRFEVDLEHVGYICCEGDYLDSEEVIEAIKQAGGTVKRGDL